LAHFHAYAADGIGSIVQVLSDSGDSVESYTYDAFGNQQRASAGITRINMRGGSSMRSRVFIISEAVIMTRLQADS
jgi:hypothetical protein